MNIIKLALAHAKQGHVHLFCGLLLAVFAKMTVGAATYTYSNASGGDASDSANWAEGNVPGDSEASATVDMSVINVGSTATFASGVYSWKDMLFSNGIVSGGTMSFEDGFKVKERGGEARLSSQLSGNATNYVHGAKLHVDTTQVNDIAIGARNGVLVLDGSLTSGSSLHLDGNGMIEVAANQTVSTLNGNCRGGRLLIDEGKTLTLTGGNAASSEFSGSLHGSGALVKQGSGYTLTLASDNTTNHPFAGSINVAAGTLTLSDGRSFTKDVTPTVYWSFDDPANPGKADVSASDNDLSSFTWSSAHIDSDVNISATGVKGCGIHPNGTVFMGKNTKSMPRANESFSVVCWAKVDSSVDGIVQLVGWGDRSTTYTQFCLCIETSGAVGIYDSYQFSETHRVLLSGSEANLRDGKWHCVAAVFDGTTLKAYVDGSLAASANATFNIKDSWIYVDIGITGTGSSGSRTVCDVWLDEMAIYRGATLSAEQVSKCFASCGAIPETATADATLPDPVAWYRFDDASNVGKDSSGNNYDLTAVGHQDNATRKPVVVAGSPISGSMYSAPGHGCIRWGGSSGGTLPEKIPTGTSPVSASLWVRLGESETRRTSTAQYDVTLFQIGTDSQSHRISINGTDDSFRFSLMNARKTTRIYGQDYFVNREVEPSWHHVAFTSDGSAISFYVDGRLQGTFSGTSTIASDGTLVIGTGISSSNDAFNQSTRLFKGNIDEVKIYDAALTAAQIAADYRSQLPRTGNVIDPSAVVSVAPGAALTVDGAEQTLTSVPTGSGVISLKHGATFAVAPAGDATLSSDITGCGTFRVAGGGVVTLGGSIGPGVSVVVSNATIAAGSGCAFSGSLEVDKGAVLKMTDTLSVEGKVTLKPGFVVDATGLPERWCTLISADDIVADGVDLDSIIFVNNDQRKGLLKIEDGFLRAKLRSGMIIIIR